MAVSIFLKKISWNKVKKMNGNGAGSFPFYSLHLDDIRLNFNFFQIFTAKEIHVPKFHHVKFCNSQHDALLD